MAESIIRCYVSCARLSAWFCMLQEKLHNSSGVTASAVALKQTEDNLHWQIIQNCHFDTHTHTPTSLVHCSWKLGYFIHLGFQNGTVLHGLLSQFPHAWHESLADDQISPTGIPSLQSTIQGWVLIVSVWHIREKESTRFLCHFITGTLLYTRQYLVYCHPTSAASSQ